MNTKTMSDETKLPGHQYTLGEMRAAIAKMREINHQFYWLCFHGGMGTACHAFIEFAGLQAKFIDMCERALEAGIEFPFANQHAQTPWPMETHHADYLGEKFHCIYGFAIGPNAELRKAFIKSGLGVPATQRADDVCPGCLGMNYQCGC
jgi:hypothetical protein